MSCPHIQVFARIAAQVFWWEGEPYLAVFVAYRVFLLEGAHASRCLSPTRRRLPISLVRCKAFSHIASGVL